MRTDLLSVALVEEIHRAVLRGKNVVGVVSGLNGVTLAGLLEYGCLRWARRNGTLPPHPQAITTSDLGRALNAIPSAIGLRSSGHQKRPPRRLDPRAAEFLLLQTEDDLTGDDWDHFAGRFDPSTRNVGFSFDAAARLQLALYEMAENAVIHAEASAILVGYDASPGKATFCVADVGIGVLASLRKNPVFSGMKLHNDAIRAALQDGATSRLPEEGGGGFGFRQVFTSLADQWGSLRFRSGEGCITMEGTGCDANLGNVTHPPPLPGFQVSICCRTKAPNLHEHHDSLVF
jgi:anti-sigma regulatory factor (Ser/Thr protein kinase)